MENKYIDYPLPTKHLLTQFILVEIIKREMLATHYLFFIDNHKIV